MTPTPGSRAWAVRFGAEAVGAFLALLTGAIVARRLGADGKGAVATLSYLVALLSPVAALGLGEAGVTLAASGRLPLSRITSAWLAALVPASLACAAAVGLLAHLALPGVAATAILCACASLPLATANLVLGLLVESQQRVVAASIIRVVVAASTTLATAVVVLGVDGGIAGGVLGGTIGWSAGAVCLVAVLVGLRGSLRPRWDTDALRAGLRLGVPVMASYLLVAAAARLDLLVVLAVRGEASAGLYSVALTLGQLTSYGPIAIAVTLYPRLPALSPDEAVQLTTRAARASFAASMLSAVVLAAVMPVLMPLAFGYGFRGGVPAAIVLAFAGVAHGLQWVLCRAQSSRGTPALIVRSYAITVAAMLSLDAILIPTWGLIGGATASAAAGCAGLASAMRGYRRLGTPLSFGDVVPRIREIPELVRILREGVTFPRR